MGLPVLRPVYLCLAVTNAPAVTDGICSLVPSTDSSLPRVLGGSAPASAVSGPAQCLRHITACRLAKSPKATLYIRGSGSFVASATAPIASGWSEPAPGRDFQPAVDQRLFTAHPQALAYPHVYIGINGDATDVELADGA
jgi:hypothetical protein